MHSCLQCWTLADQLTQAEIDQAEQAVEIWRAENVIKDFADFLPEDTE